MMAKRLAALLLLGLLAGCSAHPAAPSKTLEARLDEALNRNATTGAIFSARVIDLETGRELYSRSPDHPMIPASNMKLFVTAAALDFLGADYRFKTYLTIDGEDLWVIGTGNPAVGDPRMAKAAGKKPTAIFDDWADALRKRGVTRIGSVVYYDRALDEQWVHPAWSKSFLVDWYAAPVSGLNFNDNCVDIKLIPPSKLDVMPPTQGIKIINELVPTGNVPPAIDRAPKANIFTITGPATRPTDLESKPVVDPGAFFADAMRTHFASRGLEISGPTRRADSFDRSLLSPSKLIAVHETPMKDLLFRLNKNSQNLFAEALCKIMGRAFDAAQGRDVPGSWESGGRVVAAFFAKNAVPPGGFHLVDGSGLARENRITARLATDTLTVMFRHPSGQMYRESLSVAGQDGTLAKRMLDLKGHIFAKTGYIGGVRTLSGYIKTRGGRWLCFSILYNQVPGPVKAFEELQDEACHVLMDYRGN
ncbi:MAG TPA: D-alanyl-D-alanine carboxypeptidase/D-alanyl-D-alanine-endopeptidase [Tepidisphaeraceae bacterium]|jgi:D-alanyl-D-alanine carboxypeptidase/D-alanyl-D-alanine-endopeptidase (penicillin-binding protein 4)|nr:D-alanyl-D-alanine carboxypeptidase/D-alanyl-D-alanine-endopeptidase [Tepidisphaeraceae bacterium]HEV8604033.1 D-alanyl-D-alanine carboxypeptidase/D-alanyl-D-alanine-endopeptidase [Tepidisphaeraceae bacterium]